NGLYTDGVLEQHEADASWGFSFQGFNFGGSNRSDFGEIFGQAFGKRAERRDPERGPDLEYQMSISFEEAIAGRRARINVLRKSECSTCSGSGQAPGTRETVCDGCSGTGKTTRAKGHLQFAVTCGDCGGSGRSITACPGCGGEGRTSRTD